MGEFNRARLLGFDFLKDTKGSWHLLEVNDTPSNLVNADSLTRAGNVTVENRSVIDAIAFCLAQSESTAVILRPRKSQQQSICHDLLQQDCQAVSNRLADLGVSFRIVTPDQLDAQDGRLLIDGMTIGSVYRRTQARPDCFVPRLTVNPWTTTLICRDKLTLPELLSDCPIPSVPTHPSGDVVRIQPDSDFLVLKPRFGAASFGVNRVRTEDINTSKEFSSQIIQPWIEPDTTRVRDFDYHYDIRVLSFDGCIVSAYARLAASPVGGIGSGLEIEWLTTTGKQLPICIDKCCQQGLNHVLVSNADWSLIEDAVRVATQAIEREALIRTLPKDISSTNLERKSLLPDKCPYLYIHSADSTAKNLSHELLPEKVIKSFPCASVIDVSSIDDDIDSLIKLTGWPLLPQLTVGNEFFVGLDVICESIDSGEVFRATLEDSEPVWESRANLRPSLGTLSPVDHNSPIWGIAKARDTATYVACSADGTASICCGSIRSRYKLCSGWINSVALSPCGNNLFLGTSSTIIYGIRLDRTEVLSLRVYSGHSRWVNGVISIHEDRFISVSADGWMVLWENGVELASKRRFYRGHVLGASLSRVDGLFIVWSSCGCLSLHRVEDLVEVCCWNVPTDFYVTTVCEGVVSGCQVFFAVDVMGRVYSSNTACPVFDIGSRSWAMTYDPKGDTLYICTSLGMILGIHYVNGMAALRQMGDLGIGVTSICPTLDGSVLLGMASGEIMMRSLNWN